MKLVLYLLVILFCGACTSRETNEKWQNRRANIVNVKDTAVQFKDNQVAELQQKINSLKEALTSDKFNLTKRLIDAFPKLDSHSYHDTLEDIKRIITSRTKRK